MSSINGFGSPYNIRPAVTPNAGTAGTRNDATTGRPGIATDRTRTQPIGIPTAPGVRAPAAAAATQASLPVEPPAGTDPELWSVLTAEERGFFAKLGAMGPLTYGRVLAESRGDVPSVRGGRLDLKV